MRALQGAKPDVSFLMGSGPLEWAGSFTDRALPFTEQAGPLLKNLLDRHVTWGLIGGMRPPLSLDRLVLE